jgi:hypothetical protein
MQFDWLPGRCANTFVHRSYDRAVIVERQALWETGDIEPERHLSGSLPAELVDRSFERWRLPHDWGAPGFAR